MADIIYHEFTPYNFTPEDIVRRNPEQFEHHVSSDEALVLGCSDNFRSRPLSRIWGPMIDVTASLGYLRPKATCDVLNSIIVDAILAYQGGAYVHYSRSKSGNKAYLGIGYDRLMNALGFLMDNELIHNFIAPPNTHTHFQSFFGATPKLVESCGDHIDLNSLMMKPDVWSVQCTIRKRWAESGGKYISDKYRIKLGGEEFNPCNQDIIAQNIFLQKSNVRFTPPDHRFIGQEGSFITFRTSKGRTVTINTSKVCQRRVFVQNTKEEGDYFGGRFYGAYWHSLSETDRQFVTFDGEPAGEEFDFKAMHAQVAYAALNLAMPENPYFGMSSVLDVFSNEEIKKKACKKALLISFNAKSRRGAAGALATEMIKLEPQAFGFSWTRIHPLKKRKLIPLTEEERKPAVAIAKEIITAVIAHNEPIKSLICSDMGVRFQKIDSEIMAIAQRRCREEGIPVLGVHDSFLAPVSKNARAKEIFKEELEVALNRLRRDGLCAYDIDCPGD